MMLLIYRYYWMKDGYMIPWTPCYIVAVMQLLCQYNVKYYINTTK